DAADQQYAEHRGVGYPLGQQQPHQAGHEQPVEGTEQGLGQGQPPAREFYGMAAYLPLALGREGAGSQVGQGGDDHGHADETQPGVADLPAGWQGHHTQREDQPPQPQIAEPVGDDAEAEYPGDGGYVQTQSRVQAEAQGNAADQGVEVQVEGVADEHQRQYLTDRQRVAGITPAQQVVAAVVEVAGECERGA